MEVKKRAKIIIDWINNYCETTSFSPKSLVDSMVVFINFLRDTPSNIGQPKP